VAGQHHAPAALTSEKRPCTTLQETGLAPGPVSTSSKSLTPTDIRLPESLKKLTQISINVAYVPARTQVHSVTSSPAYLLCMDP
jgi:hypothetical protein